MTYGSISKSVFFALLVGFLCNGCSNDDLPVGNSSDSASSLGTICFNADNSAQTKGTNNNWETINVPLSADTQNREAEPTSASITSSGLLTRGVLVLGTDAPGGSFGVWGYLLLSGIWNNSAIAPSFMYNTQLTRTGTSGNYSYKYSPTKYWPSNADDLVRFFAYYPYNGDGIHLSSSTDTGYPVISYTPNANITNQVDLMYASTNAVNNKETGTAVNFSFNHALTQVCFSAKKAPGYESNKVIIQSISLTNITNKGTLSLDSSLTNPWTLSSSPADTTSYAASIVNGALIPANSQSLSVSSYRLINSYSGYLLLLPQNVTISNKVIVHFTMDGVAKVATFSLSSATWSKGQCLNFQLTLPSTPTSSTALADKSNCYILKPSVTTTVKYTLPIKRVNEYWGSTGLGNNPNYMIKGTDTWKVSVVWQDVYGLITLSTSTGTGPDALAAIQIPANAKGNAVIGIKKTSGSGILNVYLWSWHLWVTDYDPNTTNVAFNNLTWMDRNLGATSAQPGVVKTLGLLYQWGRKDPFPGSSSLDASIEPTIYNSIATTTISMIQVVAGNNLINAINNPGIFYYNNNRLFDWYTANYSGQNNSLWGGTKTIYDPCPIGWKVLTKDGWSTLRASNFTWNNSFLGRTYTGNPSFFYPTSGYRLYDSGILSGVGKYGPSWVSAVYISQYAQSPGEDHHAYSLNFRSDSVNPENYYERANGQSIRCVKE